MIEVGDIVEPKKGYTGNGYRFRVIEYDPLRRKFRLEKMPEYKENIEVINAIHFEWFDYELDLILKKSPKFDFSIPFPSEKININSEPQKIKINKEKNVMKILNLYESRMKEKIDKEYDKKIIEVRKKDELQQIKNEMLKQIDTVLENNGEKTLSETGNGVELDLYLTSTTDKVNELLMQKQEELNKLDRNIEEIDSLFYLTEDYQERMKILKNYDIVDKSGKLKF